MAEQPKPAPYKYDVTLSTGPFREPEKEIISYDFFVNRKGWLFPRVLRVYVSVKDEFQYFQDTVLGVSGGSAGQQLKVMQMLTRKIAEEKAVIALEEERIEKGQEVLLGEFTGSDAYLFPRLDAWMKEVKDTVREEIRKKVGL
jgi:hypothetical protein